MNGLAKRARLAAALALVLMLAAALFLESMERSAQEAAAEYAVSARASDIELLARLVAAEASGEPYAGQVAVAAVVLNRVKSSKFPDSIPEVIYQPGAFESVSNGLIWARTPSRTSYNAARDALNGWDPTYGCIFFWNPYKRVSAWIWARPIVTQIGRHVFAR